MTLTLPVGSRIFVESTQNFQVSQYEDGKLRLIPEHVTIESAITDDGREIPIGEDIIFPLDPNFNFKPIPEFKPKSTLEFKPESVSFLTDDPFINLNILSYVDDQTLFQLCQVNKYFNQMVNCDELWNLKLSRLMGEPPKVLDPRRKYFVMLNMDTDHQWALNMAVKFGYSDIVELLYNKNSNINPYQNYFEKCLINGHVNTVKILTPKIPNIYFDGETFVTVACNGDLDMLKLLASLDRPMFPYIHVTDIKTMIKNNCFHVLKWLHEQVPEKIEIHHVPEYACEFGNLDMLEWCLSLDPPINPSVYGARLAAENGHVNILERISQFDQPIILTLRDMVSAIRNGHLNVLEFMVKMQPQFFELADHRYILEAIRHKHSDIVWFLTQHTPISSFTLLTANAAAMEGCLDLLKWLAGKGIFPTHEVVLEENSEEISRWLASQDPPIIPEPTRRYWRVNN